MKQVASKVPSRPDPEQLVALRRALVAQALINPDAVGSAPAALLDEALGDIGGNTFFEGLCGVSFDPDHSVLNAVVEVRQAYGYMGGPCERGSTEYLRFFVDWLNDGNWDDQGAVGLTVHDLPDRHDCREQLNKPIAFAVALKIDPRHQCCDRPLLPRVRAILSWQLVPPPNTPDHIPVWGESRECTVQMPVRDCSLTHLPPDLPTVPVQEIPADLDLEFPPVPVPPPFPPGPLPWPPFPPQPWPCPPGPGPDPVPLGELLRRYKGDGRQAKPVPPYRAGFSQLARAKGNPAMAQKGLRHWQSLGLDWSQAATQLIDMTWNTAFESLCCVGWDSLHWHLLAQVEVKLPWGYSGDLCEAGSTEYVAFWLDENDTCDWTFLDVVKLSVHDISRDQASSICYSARLPWKLSWSKCNEARTAKVRAVLSWEVPPSTVDPYAPVHWGDVAEVTIQPPTYRTSYVKLNA